MVFSSQSHPGAFGRNKYIQNFFKTLAGMFRMHFQVTIHFTNNLSRIKLNHLSTHFQLHKGLCLV